MENCTGSCRYGKITDVKIISVGPNDVTFTTDSRINGATDNSPTSDKRCKGTYTASRNLIWQTVGGVVDQIPVEASVPLQVGATGPLYLDNTPLMSPGTAVDGRQCQIRGSQCGSLLRDEQLILRKWPDCGALDPTMFDVHEILIDPTSILVEAWCPATNVTATVDVWNPSNARSSQTIDFNGASEIQLHLQPAGLAKFGITCDHAQMLAVYPSLIEVTGKPASGSGGSGSVDVRDRFFARTRQRLHWTKSHRQITLALTTAGHAVFGVTPAATRIMMSVIDHVTRELAELSRRNIRVPAILASLRQISVPKEPEELVRRGPSGNGTAKASTDIVGEV